jgi:hypothetical protein
MVSSGDADVDDAVERRHRRGRGRAVRDLLPSSSAARANTVPPFEATGRGALFQGGFARAVGKRSTCFVISTGS